MRKFVIRVLLGTAMFLAIRIEIASAATAEPERSDGHEGLAWQAQKDGGQCLAWEAKSGRQVRLKGLRVTLTDPQARETWPVKLEPTARTIQDKSASLEYRVVLDDSRRPIIGSARLDVTLSTRADEDALLCRSELKFNQPVGADLRVEYVFEAARAVAQDSVVLPERSGKALTEPLRPNAVQCGKFRLGMGAGDAAGHDLGMPVIGFCWDDADGKPRPLQLAVAADPYCGCSISTVARTGPAPPVSGITVSTTYRASAVPLTAEKRTLSLEFHHNGADGTFRSFYRTIPEIEPGPQWTQGVQLVYYDYLSEKGEGWFKDLRTLADKVPVEASQPRGRLPARLVRLLPTICLRPPA